MRDLVSKSVRPVRILRRPVRRRGVDPQNQVVRLTPVPKHLPRTPSHCLRRVELSSPRAWTKTAINRLQALRDFVTQTESKSTAESVESEATRDFKNENKREFAILMFINAFFDQYC